MIAKVAQWVVEKAKGLWKKGKEAVKAGVAAVVEWWREKKPFKSVNGADHTLKFQGEAKDATLYVNRVDTPLSNYIGKIRQSGVQIPQRVTDIQEEIYSLRVRFEHGDVPERLGQPGQKIGKRISELLKELGKEMEKLPDPVRPDQNLVMPESKLVKNESWETTASDAGLNANSFDGKVVEVKPLSIKPGSLVGSFASYESELFKSVKRRGVYDKGHLLGAHVYGPGDSTGGRWNLAPITKTANRNMTSIEDKIHRLIFNKNRVLWIKVTVDYPKPTTIDPHHPIRAEYFLPTKISYELKTMKPPKVSSDQDPAEVNKARESGENWIEHAVVPVDPVKSNPPINEPLDIRTLNTTPRKTICDITKVIQPFAEAIVKYARSHGFRDKLDFESKMTDAATTKILVLRIGQANPYDPTQKEVDENAKKISKHIDKNLIWIHEQE